MRRGFRFWLEDALSFGCFGLILIGILAGLIAVVNLIAR